MRNLTKIKYKDTELNTAINFLLDYDATNKEIIRYITYDDNGMQLNNISLWDKDLSDRATKYIQHKLKKESRDIMIDDKVLQTKTDSIVYVPIYNNGELWEDNWTAPPDKAFKSREACAKWIEAQEECSYYYTYNKTSDIWQLPIGKNDLYDYDIAHPDGFYRIYRVELVE